MPGSLFIGNRYKIDAPPIGHGGMGIIYKAFDTGTKRFVALKTIKGSVDSSAIEHFRKEWSVLAGLCHPNIVDVLDVGEFEENQERKPYFVMPLLRGATLDQLLKNSGHQLTQERVVEIMCQVCRGLQAAHDQNLVHRDLKPSNLFVMEDDTVKIIDFGVVHLISAASQTTVKGTPHYMAPEQFENQPATARSDLFSLGVVCYEALTGRRPFDGDNLEQLLTSIRRNPPPSALDLNPSLNVTVAKAVHKALAKQPYHRFSSVREFSEVLQRAMRNERVEQFDPTRTRPRIDRVKKALNNGDHPYALEILSELESEGAIDAEISLLRMQAEQALRAKMVQQLLEGARSRIEEEEFPLALQKVQSVLELDPTNVDALALKGEIDRRRAAARIEQWLQIAQQHLANGTLSKAREAVAEILRLDAADKNAQELLKDITRREGEQSKLRQEKQQLYDSALRAYKNGEISSALNKLEKVLELGKRAPGHPNTEAQYLAFYEQIRSERDEIQGAYIESKAALDSNDFAKALEICKQMLRRRPGDPFFQALKIEIDDRERQVNSAAIADLNSRVESEIDLDKKYRLLKEAVARFPEEQVFVQALKITKEKRDLVNAVVTKARHYESEGQLAEASSQWDVVRTIYERYPGLEHEVNRLKRKQDQQVRDETKGEWTRKIGHAIEVNDEELARVQLRIALSHLPDDPELLAFDQQLQEAAEKRAAAQSFFQEGQVLETGGNRAAAIEKFRSAYELDNRNPSIRNALLRGLVAHAQGLVATDWKAALPLCGEALELDGNDPAAAELSRSIDKARLREQVQQTVARIRDLIANGRRLPALELLTQARQRFPGSQEIAALDREISGTPASQQSVAEAKPQSERAENAKAVAATGSSKSASLAASAAAPAPAVASATELLRSPVPSLTPTEPLANRPPSAARKTEPPRAAPDGAQPQTATPKSKAFLVPVTGVPEPAPTRHGNRLGIWAGIVAAVLALLAAGGWFWSQNQNNQSTPVHIAAAVAATPPQPRAVEPSVVKPVTPSADTHAPQQSPQPPAVPAGHLVQFNFESDPEGARVRVDDRVSCTTPCSLKLAPGLHSVSASAPDHDVLEQMFDVSSEMNSITLRLKETMIAFHLVSDPPHLPVTVDGESKGTTPLVIELTPGPHRLLLKSGGQEHSETIELTKDDSIQSRCISFTSDSTCGASASAAPANQDAASQPIKP